MPTTSSLCQPLALSHTLSQTAQALWNTRDASRVTLAYTPDSTWRIRSTFVRGRGEIEAFLRDKWTREEDYVLRKEVSFDVSQEVH